MRGERLWKNAQPFDCGRSHLSVADYYEGLGGIDFRWSAERQRHFAACGVREPAVKAPGGRAARQQSIGALPFKA